MTEPNENPITARLIITVLLGFLTFVLGVALGTISLVSQQVNEVSQLPPPEERKSDVVYFRKGSEAPNARWRGKRNQLIRENAGPIRLSESDLNDWARTSFTTPAATPSMASAGETGEAVEGEQRGFFHLERKASAPNFAIIENQLQIASYLELPSALGSRRFVYRVLGDFEADEEGVLRFVPRGGTLGSAPLLYLPVIGPQLHAHVTSYFKSFPEWEEIGAHWTAVSAAAIEEDELTLTVGVEAP